MYQEEEGRGRLRDYGKKMWPREELGGDDRHKDFQTPNRTQKFSAANTYRIRRFFETIRGFHSGSLDLTGRHERRYWSIMKRWNCFVTDVFALSQNSVPVIEDGKDFAGNPLLDQDGNPIKVTSYIPGDLDILRTFEDKWHTHGTFTLSGFLEETMGQLKYLAQHPMPKFQRLCLVDLPVEVIELIIETAVLDGSRLLGSTSRFLHEISSSYIFKTRRLVLTHDVDWDTFQSLPDEEASTYMLEHLNVAKEHFVNHITFLCTRSDITQKLKDLSIDGFVDPGDLQSAGITDTDDYNAFFDPIYRGLCDLLPHCHRLRYLSIDGMTLSHQMVILIMSIPELCSLILRSCACDVQFDHKEALRDSASLRSLSLVISNRDQCSSWDVLLLSPGVRSLNLSAPEDHLMVLPAFQHNPDLKHLRTIQTLNIAGLSEFEVPDLSAWIRRSAPHLRITHFKLDVNGGLNEFDILDLILSLSGAPINTFVLKGIRNAEPALLDTISSAFPNLRSLTLYYRDSDRQVRSTKSTIWPYPTWEYAPHFRGFHHLESFRWNFRVETREPTTSILPYFEDAYSEHWWDTEYFDDWECVIRLLLVYCPTLHLVSFLSGDRPTLEYLISKADNGTASITRAIDMWGVDMEERVRAHDPLPRWGEPWN